MNNCLTWGNVWSEWKDAMWKWPHCPVCDTWGQTTFKWDAVYWTFTECQLVEEVITALVSGSGALNPAQPQQTVEPWEPWNPYRDEKKKKWIELLCRVKGYDEEQTKKALKENASIRVSDVKFLIESTRNISVEIV